jgi:hypothetical protein
VVLSILESPVRSIKGLPTARGIILESFHGADPNLIINGLKFVLDVWKTYRSRNGQEEHNKSEEVLGQTVEKAQEMSAGGASADQLVSEIETRLERDLGTVAKDEIISRVSSMVALARPFEVDSFQYYEYLVLILKRAQEFCRSTNIFKLRGEAIGAAEYLDLPQLASVLPGICGSFKVFTDYLIVGNVFAARPILVKSYLSTARDPLQVLLTLELKKAYSIGGSYAEQTKVALSLTKGSEVNKIGFDLIKSVEFPSYFKGAEFRLTNKEFQAIASAIFDDLNNYVAELAEEEKRFREQFAPALVAILGPWMKS